MIKYIKNETMVVFAEIPDEVTLAINISNCQNNCIGCHSPYLRENIGDELTFEAIDKLVEKNDGITCICFMGEGNDIESLCKLSKYISDNYNLATGLYSGQSELKQYMIDNFNYVKVGPYIEEYGPLNKKTTNQRLYYIYNGEPLDITYKFWKQ